MSLLVVLLVCVLIVILCNAFIPAINVGTDAQPRTIQLGLVIALIFIIVYLTGSFGGHTFRLY